jgi:ribosomal protein S18 acetylase RimI-like enzyme
MSSTADVVVTPAEQVDEDLVAAMGRLLPQLSRTAAVPGPDELTEIVGAPGTVLLVARQADRVVGSLTLVTFRIPSAVRAWIEDVVVDESARGAGVGEALVHAALEVASQRGARTVDLTSRATREAANRLYQRMGFGRRETNVYRYPLDETGAPGGFA